MGLIDRTRQGLEAVIQVRELTRNFGNFVAVDHISFEVKTGEIVGYLGPNGCGKTTTIRMLLGLLKPTSGNATVYGYDSFHQSEIIRSMSGYMSQKFAIYDDLTVMENLTFYGGAYGIADKEQIRKTITNAGLDSHTNTLTRELSTGWRQRLALAIALVHSPRLLFLDEPTSGVDPNARREFWDLIYNLAAESVTVLVTTHYMDEAEYCHRLGMMRDGKLLAMGTPSDLKTSHVRGLVYELFVDPLIDGLEILHHMDGVLLASLSGDHIRIIVEKNIHPDKIKHALAEKSIQTISVQVGEPTLEDVFANLARK